MNVVLVAAGVALLLLPGQAARVGARLRPAEWSRLAFASAWMGLGAVRAGLFLTAAPTVLRGVGVEEVAEACHRITGPIMPGGSLVGWAAAGTFAVVAVRGRQLRQRAGRIQRLARIESWLGEHRPIPGGSLVVLPCDELLAYAAPGSPTQVVVSRRLDATLDEDELHAVIRHELAHVHHHHARYLLLLQVIDGLFGWLPGMSATTGAIRLAVERCADEEAAAVPASRDAVRRALERVTETMLAPIPTFTAAWTIGQRLLALAEAPPAPTVAQRVAVGAPMAGLMVVVAGTFAMWSSYTHHGLFGLIGCCPL